MLYISLMRSLNTLTAAILIIWTFIGVDALRGDTSPPQKQLKTYALPVGTQSADISPDEQTVVTVLTKKLDPPHVKDKTNMRVVQLWDFKEGEVLAQFVARQPEQSIAPKGISVARGNNTPIVRFSPDGTQVVALLDRMIHILRASDLAEVRAFALMPPSNTPDGPTIVREPSLRAMELSPSGGIAAVLWFTYECHGRIQLYDILSGNRLLSWDTTMGWTNFQGRGIVWNPNGKLLLVAIPNFLACGSPSGGPDIFAFDVRTGAIKRKITSGLLIGNIAITSDNRVLAVDSDSYGVFSNHHPKLKFFDFTTGKHLHSVSARPTGVRYMVSASPDGDRFIAFTGKMSYDFDWSDAVSYDKVVDETFSVWSLSNYEGILTSQNIPGLKGSELKLSSKGNYAFSYGKASFVYELP
jgi:hypothetical protein